MSVVLKLLYISLFTLFQVYFSYFDCFLVQLKNQNPRVIRPMGKMAMSSFDQNYSIVQSYS